MRKLSPRPAFFAFVVGLVFTSRAALSAPLLPDIIMEAHNIAQTTTSGVKELRFSTWTINVGAGPLELRATNTHPDGSQDVNQRIYDSDGVNFTDTYAGTFAVVGGRLRFTDSADYFLKEVTANDGVGGIVGATEKLSYCIVDSGKYTTSPPGTPANAHYTTCGPVMGISVGWVDLYSSSISTQAIALTGISDGVYWLENIGDPTNRLMESDDTNNTYRVKVTINTTGLSPEIDVIGNGQSIPNNDSTPSTSDGTDFGLVDVANDALTRTFTIQNSGTGSLSLTGAPKVQITGSSDFTVTLQPVSPVKIDNPTTTFQITFSPSSAGLKTATVIIPSNDANESSYQFTIRGNGVPDTDGDGEDDISEAASGTDPNNPNSFVRSGKQLNISTRLDVQTGDNIGIAGFIITGSGQKNVLLRALGPSLIPFGVTGALLDPTIELHDQTGAAIAFNNDWKTSQQTEIQNTGLAPGDDHEAAMVRSLAPGPYTAFVQGNGNTSGIGLVEVYDLDFGVNPTLANTSTRGWVGTGDNVMIGGRIIGGGLGANGSGSAKILVRGIGPSLAQAQVPNPLQDPILELHDGNGAIIASNDNWRDTQQSAIQATGLAPNDDRESAILTILTKGSYTAILRGKNNTTGIALIEAYKIQ
ncbi:MAG TPA: choice-of-anchor D domain-containing protein [Chthoniobacterales bacterium]|nr:choice-of-anchor D domain-containing protein [Chthoniobacterales bacterium]